MSNLQVKNVPDSLHHRLRDYAKTHHCTLSEIVLKAIERELMRLEWNERMARRPEMELGVSTASLLDQARGERESELM